MTNFTESRRDTCDAAKLGRLALAESFRTLHSTVRSDLATMSCIGGGWPAFLRDEVDGDAVAKRWYSPAQIRRAEEMCDALTGMRGHDRWEKKDAVRHALTGCSWRQLAKLTGSDWRVVRNAVESVYVRFAYVVADHEGVSLGRPVASTKTYLSTAPV